MNAMAESFTQRTEMLLGPGVELLKSAAVAVFGLGGVGSWCAEALCRAGVGKMLICDGDCVSITNVNRQLCALDSTVGLKKCGVVFRRLKSINPEIELVPVDRFIRPGDSLDFLRDYSYVADCIDDVPAKLEIITFCKKSNIPIISAMGCGNRIYPEKLRITDIYKTSGCPLARSVRAKLRKAGVDSLDVVFSDEAPLRPNGGTGPGSVSFVPSAAGLIMAGKIVRSICGIAP